MSTALLERDRELSALRDAIARAADGHGCLVLLRGPAGIGKSQVLRAGMAEAEAAGMTVLGGRATEADTPVPFALAVRVLRDAADRRTLRDAAGLSAPLFSATPPSGDTAELEQLLHGLHWLVANLAERAAVLLAVDDVQWADVPSLRWLVHLAAHLEELPVVLVAAERSGPAPAGGADVVLTELRDLAGPVLVPAPLTHAAVERVVADALTRHPDPVFTSVCARASGGNPFVLRELLAAIAAEGLRPDAQAAERVHDLLRHNGGAAGRERVQRLDDAARSLAVAAAVLGEGHPLALTAQLSGLAPPEAEELAAQLVADGMLAEADPVYFAHPLLRAAVRDSVESDARGALQTRASQVLAAAGVPADVAAAHLLEAPPAGDPDSALRLREAARIARARAAPQAAAAFLRRALAEEPDAPDCPAALAELAQAEVAAGTPEAGDRLAEAVAATEDDLDRARLWLLIGRTEYTNGRPAQAVAALERALDCVGDRDEVLRSEIETVRAVTEMVGLGQSGRATQVLRRSAAPSDRPPGHGERAALAQLAVARTIAVAGTATEAVDLAERAYGGGALIAEEPPGSVSVSALTNVFTAADQLDRACEVATAALENGRRRGSPLAVSTASFTRTWPLMYQGRLADAIADAQFALRAAPVRWGGYEAFAHAVLSMCHTERGELDEAEEAAWSISDDTPGAMQAALLLRARARVRRAQGRLEESRDLILQAGARDAIRNPGVSSWRADAAVIHAALGERDAALQVVEDEVEVARAWGAPRPLGVALRAQGIATGGDRGLALLQEAVTVLEDSTSTLEMARALSALGGALRRDGRLGQARAVLMRALDLAHGIHAVVIAERVREDLVQAGARPRRVVRGGGVEALTPTERRVAAMAARGMSNREIAQAQFVTAKAIEKHLSNVYAKLGISSRQALPDGLALP